MDVSVEAKQGFLCTVNAFIYGNYLFDMYLIVFVVYCDTGFFLSAAKLVFILFVSSAEGGHRECIAYEQHELRGCYRAVEPGATQCGGVA